jgi:hypothetical protein
MLFDATQGSLEDSRPWALLCNPVGVALDFSGAIATLGAFEDSRLWAGLFHAFRVMLFPCGSTFR